MGDNLGIALVRGFWWVFLHIVVVMVLVTTMLAVLVAGATMAVSRLQARSRREG